MNNTSWRLEQLQTRARIQASQSRFWLKQAVGLWACCAVVAFMIGCSAPERKNNAVIWLWASLTPLKSVTWQGEQYQSRELANWLSGTIYNGTPGEWVIWAVGCGLLPVTLLGGGGLWYVRRQEPSERHIRGAEVLSVEELRGRVRKEEKPGIAVATMRIPEELHRSHFLICGATGSGKTVTIRQMLRQIAQRNEPCIVVDPEGEFVREFYAPSRGDHLLNPLDARFPGWDPWGECESAPDMEAQAASLFSITPEMNAAATYFHRCARVVYRAILEKLPDRDPGSIPELLSQTEKLLRCIAGTDAAELLGKRANDNRQGILSTVRIACTSFRYLTQGAQSWSARDWVEQQKGWCFLTLRETEKEAVLPILSLWLESLTRRLLTSEIAPARTIWVVIDELAVLRAQPTLVDLMNRGRKRGVAVVLGFQNVLQLYPIYGEKMANNMIDQPSTRLLLRTNNGETQQWCAENIGKREVMRPVESETAGPENLRDSINRSHQRRGEPAVMGSEFGMLPNLSGYLKVAHYGAAKVQIPYTGMADNQPAFVPLVPVEEERVERVIERESKGVISKSRRAL